MGGGVVGGKGVGATDLERGPVGHRKRAAGRRAVRGEGREVECTAVHAKVAYDRSIDQ